MSRVYLVGAGPGDPELITVKALRALEQAEVVLVDALANPALLSHCADDALIYDVGKLGYGQQTPQEVTNRILVDEARRGKRVVRLKGGDPFVFGRGGEEAIALAEAGLDYEVVPGISSAISAPMAAGIPVTHRGVSSMVTVVTGAGVSRNAGLADAWVHLARAGGTLVFLMAVRSLERVEAALLEGGLDPSTPAALVESATRPGERVTEAPLGKLAATARSAGVRAPAVLVVGQVVALREQLAPVLAQSLQIHA